MFQQLPYQKVKYLEVKKETGNVILESVPSACPICKTSIEPVFIETYNVNNLIYAVFRRPVTEYEEYYLLKFFFNKNHPRPKKVYSFNNYAGQVSAELKNLEIIQDLSPKDLRKLVDAGKKELGEGIVVVFASKDGKIGLAVGVTDKLTTKYDAVKFVKMGSKIVGGKGGGGRPDFAQAGGIEINKIDEAFEKLKALI